MKNFMLIIESEDEDEKISLTILDHKTKTQVTLNNDELSVCKTFSLGWMCKHLLETIKPRYAKIIEGQEAL